MQLTILNQASQEYSMAGQFGVSFHGVRRRVVKWHETSTRTKPFLELSACAPTPPDCMFRAPRFMREYRMTLVSVL